MRGPSIEVVKAYERFIRELEDRRLLAKNRKARSGLDAFDRETYTDQVIVELIPPAGGVIDVREVALRRDSEIEDTVRVGDAQDADAGQTAVVSLETGAWSSPMREEDGYFRRASDGTDGRAQARFELWFYYSESRYTIAVTYRSKSGVPQIVARRAGSGEPTTTDLPETETWRTEIVELRADDPGVDRARPAASKQRVSRWPGEGSLEITDVLLLDARGREQAVFEAHSEMRLVIDVVAMKEGDYPVTATATMYRADGVLVTNHVGGPWNLELVKGEHARVAADFGRLNLGDGHYVFSIGVYRSLSPGDAAEVYDLLDRSYEFEVIGNPPFDNGVFSHPSEWTVDARPSVTVR